MAPFLERLESMLEHKRSMETGSSDLFKGMKIGLDIYDLVDNEFRNGNVEDMRAIARNKGGRYPTFLVSYVQARLPQAEETASMKKDYQEFVSRRPGTKTAAAKKTPVS